MASTAPIGSPRQVVPRTARNIKADAPRFSVVVGFDICIAVDFDISVSFGLGYDFDFDPGFGLGFSWL